jgi:hypothetical protein
MSPPDRRPSAACPASFQDLCRTASTGGDGGYAAAGYALAGAVAGLLDEQAEDLHLLLEQLEAAIIPPGGVGQCANPPDDAAVLAWLDRELPGCMELIPPDGRASFLRGFYQAVLQEESPVTED